MDEKRPNRRQRRLPRKIDAGYLENAALYYLQRYATSSQNLKNVLTRKIRRSCAHHGDDPDQFLPLVDKIALRYQEVGLLDDKVYAEGRVAALRRQGLSKQAIQQKLSLKGLAAAEITQALARIDAAANEDDHELAAARRLARRKKIGPWRSRPLSDDKAAHKELAVLARAGFSYDTAKRALQTSQESIDTEYLDF